MTCFVGIDLGTTNIKLLALNPASEAVVALVSAPLTTLTPRPGYAEQDPDAIWQALEQFIPQLTAQTNVRQAAIQGVGFSGAMHSLLAVDADGKPLTNAILWSDNRAEAEAAELRTRPTSHRRRYLSANRYAHSPHDSVV